mmetsp:Transcript_43651/g.105837  ORF Transcript_43651/g.105837 Transcript_43651/m.105837 type:complete len:291 (-) Transcript_43651:90-962(-)
MAYIQQLVIELGPNSNYMELRTIIPPLLDFRDELHRISMDDVIHGNIRERSYEMLDRLSSGRQQRVTSLQTTFPPLHYGTITTLSLAILFVFLIETDRPVILFTNNFQLRLVWGLLVGTITAIYCIGIDLSYPFVGTYCVPSDRLLEESDEILKEIKSTFPDRELLQKSNGINGSDVIVLVEEEVEDDDDDDYDYDESETLQQAPTRMGVQETMSSPSQGMTYVDTIQQQNVVTATTTTNGANGSASSISVAASSPVLPTASAPAPAPAQNSDWSQMTAEEMNRRWIQGN